MVRLIIIIRGVHSKLNSAIIHPKKCIWYLEMTDKIQRQITIPLDMLGLRFDQGLARLLPEFSRTQVQEWLKSGEIKINGAIVKARNKIEGGEHVTIEARRKEQPIFDAQPIQLNIIHEDEQILVINKPIGMVVHPAAGNASNTLLNALLYHTPELQELPRAGIVHRLDKDTSGLLVIAKTREALTSLTKQIKSREMERIYQAIVYGVITSGGTIDEPIGRHPIQRKRMAVIDTGKTAITHFRVIERYRTLTRIKVKLETGRTHQIRVHMAHIHFPIFGDQTYGKRLQLPKKASDELIECLRNFKRQALHAYELAFIHPTTLIQVRFTAPLPDDIEKLINMLKKDSESDKLSQRIGK